MSVPLSLGQKQQAFVPLVAKLITEAYTRGYTLTLGEAWRSPQEAARLAKTGAGIAHSLHTQRLAIDLNLFIDGAYQSELEAYRALGEWWEQQSTPDLLCCWGGRFTIGDGDHFSIEHDGVK